MTLKAVKVRTTLTGTTELNMHNIQLADPDNFWTKQIAKLTGKRKMSEEDRREKARLEFLGGLYTNSDGERTWVIVPQTNVKRCFKEAAKANRLGRNIDRALNYADPQQAIAGLPLVFEHSDLSPDELWAMPQYHDTTIVASPGRVPRTRPRFMKWSLTADWLLFTNLLSVEDLRDIGEYAGLIEGLGDNRVNGAGRFNFVLTEL
jgi:hypothetical protein